MARLPHARRAAEFANPVIEHLAGLNVGDDRCAGHRGQHRHRKYAQDLIAPDDPTCAIDRTQPVAVAVECQSEIELVVDNEPFQVGEVLFLGRVGVVVGEGAVNIRVKCHVNTGQRCSQPFDHGTRRAIARVPADTEVGPVRLFGIIIAQQPCHVIVEDRKVADGAFAALPVAVFGKPRDVQNVGAEERRVGQHHFEPVVFGRIVAAGDLHRAIDLQHGFGIIEHRRGTQPDTHDIDTAFGESAHQRRLQRWR